MAATSEGHGEAFDATLKTSDAPRDLEAEERARRKEAGDAIGQRAARDALDEGIKGAEQAVAKAKAGVDAALDAVNRLKAERKALD